MNKTVKIILGIAVLLALVYVLKYFKDSNAKEIIDYKTESPFFSTLDTKIVATGKLNPEEEIELKPQISGIIDAIFVEEGDLVRKGDLIARIRVVPNEQALVSAKSRINSLKLSFNNSQTVFNRNKTLFEKGVISKQDFENSELSLNQSKENYEQAQDDYQIIKQGSLSGGSSANTTIVAQIPGTILEIPVREGDQVIQSNNFNAGTTIATVADMSQMIFEGKVDESEVGKLEEGKDIIVVLGAINEKEFPAVLTFVAPKGVEQNGAVQFTIKADVDIDSSTRIRAGYSANAEIELESKDSVLVIKEALLQFNRITEKPFVELLKENGRFQTKNVEIGISDGINVEIIEGIKEGDEIKIWNKASGSNITLKQLSSILGVSISTISKALNDSHEISDATKKRIVELAKLHNYQPNKIAVGLKSGKTNTIAVVIPSIQNSFFARALYGIESMISDTNFNIIVCLTKESHAKEVETFNMLSNGVVDGFIVAVCEETQNLQNYDHFTNVIDNGKTVVMFDRVIDSVDCGKVTTNDFTALSEATQKLISSGRKQIILLSTIHKLNVGKQRAQGYVKAMEAAGLPAIMLESDDKQAGAVMGAYLKSNVADAVIALDTDASLAALKAVKASGKQIPKDIAVIGYVSERMAHNLTPELTTINQHSYTIGNSAATMMVEALRTKSKEIKQVVVSSTLSVRDSS